MSVIKVKNWMFRCDGCGFETIVRDVIGPPRLPEGWGERKVHDCGMTGYTRTDELCLNCLVKKK